MKINLNQNINFKGSKDITKSLKNEDNIICEASYSSLDGGLTLKTDKKGCFDARRNYAINKNGSGRIDSAWGWKTYPEGTFLDVLEQAKTTFLKDGKFQFNKEEILAFQDKIENVIKKL